MISRHMRSLTRREWRLPDDSLPLRDEQAESAQLSCHEGSDEGFTCGQLSEYNDSYHYALHVEITANYVSF